MTQAVFPRQLALALPHADSRGREDFLEGPPNAAALAMIERWPDWPDRILALVGPEGSGKSHLAAIWAAQSGARFLAGRALDEANLPAALATGALVVEDVSEARPDETVLFHLINMVREEGAYLLLTGRTPPSSWPLTWPVRLRDLASRLRALPAVTVEAPDDALFRAVLVKLFADRQLAVEESLVAYLSTRLHRSLIAARAAVERLDREALLLGRPVNRALAADLYRERSLDGC